MSDKRITGEGAMKGWITRRRLAADRRKQYDALLRQRDALAAALRGLLDAGPKHAKGKDWSDYVAAVDVARSALAAVKGKK